MCWRNPLRDWGGEPEGETLAGEQRSHGSITNPSQSRTVIHGADTVVTQLNDSAVTG